MADAGELDARLRSNTEGVAAEVKEALLHSQQEIVGVLNQKAYKSDTKRMLQAKADTAWVERELQERFERHSTEVKALIAGKADASQMADELEQTRASLGGKVAADQVAQLRSTVQRLGDDAEARARWPPPAGISSKCSHTLLRTLRR